MKVTTRYNPKFNIFCAVFKQISLPPAPECSVNDAEYINMLEEFLIVTLEEVGPNDMLFQQDGTPSNFHVVILELRKPRPN
jgi:hypothetical protein